ncbi:MULTISPECIES: hypothetical protein [Cyanophyceae]|uniref:hypothetical protein n=1 Tax=Cyanophyceae TaxID=3028117 RepID=UPI001688A812|nr:MULTISPECIES: hypothetical protein [unclassified Coleofasciculus]
MTRSKRLTLTPKSKLTWYKRSRPYKPVSWVNSGELPSRFIQFNTFFLSQPLL